MGKEANLRVLVVRVGALGDVLHGLPAVAALRARMPEVHIGWAVDPRWVPVLAGDSGGLVDRIHEVPTRVWKTRPLSNETLQSVLTLRRELRAGRYDVCVDLQGTIRSAVIGRMSGAPRYIGSAKPREREAAWLYKERVDVRAPSVVRQACELMSRAVEERLVPGAVTIPRQDRADRWWEHRVGLPPACLLVPGAGWGAKQWPTESFAALGRALCANQERVLVNSSHEEDGPARQVAKASGGEQVVCDLAEMIAMVRRARLVVGGDTGPVHLAAALGVPTVALFGPTDPERNGPDFPSARVCVLRHRASVTSYRRTSTPEAGLARLTVGQVMDAARTLLGEQRHG